MKTEAFDILVVPTPECATKNCGLVRIDFSDAYQGHVTTPDLTAMQVARAIFENPPRFAVVLMALRNKIVQPFGLKTSNQFNPARTNHRMVGIFPLLSESPDAVILGGDDKHLDFRIHVSVHEDETGCELTLSTLVSVNNLFGKMYLFSIMPFHRMLSRHMLGRGLRHSANAALHTDSRANR